MGASNAPSLTTNGPVMSLTNNPMRAVAVETVGYYLYGVYVFASMIVLLNLLIAVMSNTFNEVQVLAPFVCVSPPPPGGVGG